MPSAACWTTSSKNHDEAMIAEHPGRVGQRGLQQFGVDQPERPDDRPPVDTARVVRNLSGMQRHPQPDARLVRVLAVVLRQRLDQRGRELLHEQALGELGRHENEDAVPAILVSIWCPGEFGLPECVTYRLVETLAYR